MISPAQPESGPIRLADVAFSARAGGSDAVYTYRASPGLNKGDVVLATLGARSLPGVIAGLRECEPKDLGFPLEKLRDLDGRVEGVSLPGPLMDMVEFAAREYLCSLSGAIAPAMPPGLADALETTWALDEELLERYRGPLTEAQSEVLAAARAQQGRLRPPKRPVWPAPLKKAVRLLEAKGLLRRTTTLAAGRGIEEAPALFRLTSDDARITEFLRVHSAKRPAQALTLLRLQESGREALAAADIQALSGVTGAVVKALAEAGLLEPVDPAEAGLRRAPTPNSDQVKAIEAVVRAQRSRIAKGFLLYGVTGSGKTEVYLRAAAEALRAGKQVLYLVPEIALATQVIGQLRERFGRRVAVLHSELTPRARLDNWRRIAEGKAPVVLGARSALFAPLKELGLIVMDEEHEGAYKQESSPRYHARRLVRFLAKRHGCPYVLGSATPSIETFYEAKTGALERLDLPSRTAAARLPEVFIDDLGSGFRRGEPALLGAKLQELLRESLAQREQAILFLNRRAYSPFLICRDCGHFFTCPRCAVSLTYSRRYMRLRCHHCGHQERPPDVCPQCQGRRLNPFGVGTEKVEEAVQTVLPEARVARLDRDVAQRKNALEATLAAFGAGEIDVLVGTQIVAKGLNFPRVTTVGVIAADVSLNIPDFRAGERTFQLLSQVAGRAGRGQSPGRVVIQTFNPGHLAIRSAQAHDYETFFEATIREREEANYPPYCRLLNVVFSGPGLAEVIRAGDEARRRLAAALPNADLLGPADCPIERIQNQWRKHLLAKLPLDADVEPAGRALAGIAGAKVAVIADVDPVSLA